MGMDCKSISARGFLVFVVQKQIFRAGGKFKKNLLRPLTSKLRSKCKLSSTITKIWLKAERSLQLRPHVHVKILGNESWEWIENPFQR